MSIVMPLLIVFLFGIVASAACSVLVVGCLRLVGLVPQSDVERAAGALLAYAPAKQKYSHWLSRIATAVASLILPFSISAALGLAAVLPNSGLRPAVALLREEAKEQPLTTGAADVSHPPDVWGAFGEVERDIKIAYRYEPIEPLVSGALITNSADRFLRLLQRCRSSWSSEINEKVIALRGFNGAISSNELLGLYNQLALSWKSLPQEDEINVDLLEKVRVSLDELTA